MSVPWLKGPQTRAKGPAAGRVVNPATVKPQQLFSGGVKDPTGKTSEYSSMQDECPVCKSDRYLNPKLRLLVSTCYHKMCESCIDRLFTLGPQGCPICGKTLRKMAFAPQTFEDLVVEKEVAVRRRMAKEFNKRRDDFPDLKSYNNYLEEVEDITFNLIHETNMEETEARIAAYRKENAAIIELNLQREQRDAEAVREEEERLKKEHALRAEQARLQEEDERREIAKNKREIIDSLQSAEGSSAKRIIAKSRAHQQSQKKLQAQRAAALAASSSSTSLPPHLSLAALRANPAYADVPFVPPSPPLHASSFSLRERYVDPGTDAVLQSVVGMSGGAEDVLDASGFDLKGVWERAIALGVGALTLKPLGWEEEEGSAVAMEVDGDGKVSGDSGASMKVEMITAVG